MKRIQGILFDLGNTLSKSASLSESLAEIYKSSIARDLNLHRQQLLETGKELERLISETYQERPEQPDWREVWEQAPRNCGIELKPEVVERLCRTHLVQYVMNCEVEAYSIPLLESLRKRGIPLGLVSNVTGPVDIFEGDLSKKGLASFFNVVVWSSKVGCRKPDPKIFKIALDGLHLEPGRQIVMVGDDEKADIAGGKEMGVTTIKVVENGEKADSVADYVVDGNELQKLFAMESLG